MNIAILGSGGQLGKSLSAILDKAHNITKAPRDVVDITHLESLNKFLEQHKPQIIINCAAYTNVDQAEIAQDEAMMINANALEHLAIAARNIGAIIIHFSTDYVFDGESKDPYSENDLTNPVNFYGKSKLTGEKILLKHHPRSIVLRVSWLHSKDGQNFLKKILDLSNTQNEIKIVNDQFGSPTSTFFISSAMKYVLKTLDNSSHCSDDIFGTYHLSPTGSASWFQFAEYMKSIKDGRNYLFPSLQNVVFIPAESADFKSIAKRPKFSKLDSTKFSKIFDYKLPCWEEAMLNEYK